MILGVTLVVTGTLGVVLRVVVRVMVVVVVAGVTLAVDTSRVVTLSRTVVGLGAAVEVVVCSDQDGSAMVVALVDNSTLPVTGCVVSVTGCTMTGLRVVVTTAGGALVEAVVRGVSTIPGTGGGGGVTSFLVVVAAISGDIVVLVVVVVVVAAAEVAEVTTGFDVTGRRGTSVVLVEVTTWMPVSEVTSGVVFTVGL